MSTQPLSPDSFQTFGELLKYLRRREHLTQLELSIAVGYSEAQIGRLEQNQRKPDVTAVKALFIPALHLEEEPELAQRLVKLAQSARQEDAPAAGSAPYKGLLFFDQADADLFFGRDTLTAHLVERVTHLAENTSSRFLAVVGASGSGKSSLVRAGLAVALQRLGWKIHAFTPTANPLKMLADYYPPASENGQPQLVLVDQFEETFTLCHDENERLAFIDRLMSIAQDQAARIIVVIALRADFYSHCAQYPLLREAVAAQQEYIGQMTQEELRHAIEEPARRGGWEFERGLVDVLLNDIGADGSGQPEPGALPLLSHALLATWERRRGRTLTLEGYRASGGVRGAIAETAESVFTDQLNRAQQDLARDIFLRLTELGEGTDDTRRRATLNELARQSEEAMSLRTVLNTLADARLITLNEDTAEVAHEALIREWQRLHEWLTEDREGLRLHRHLTDSALEWEARGHDAAELYRGARLAQTSEWASTNEARLNQVERDFLAASITQEQREAVEREAQRRRELEVAHRLAEEQQRRAEEQSRNAKRLRRRAIFLAGAFVLAIVMAGAALFFGNQANQNAVAAQTSALSAQQNAQEAQSQQRVATSRELAAAAISNLSEDPERSILLALQAESTVDTLEAENALHRSVLTSRVERVLQHDAQVWSVTYSPDGKRVATASQDKTAKIWDAATGQLLQTLIGHTDSVNGVVFSPDGKHIATTSDDFSAKVWDVETGKELLTLLGHTNWVYRIAFSPDGARLVTTSEDKTIKVWDANTGKELNTLHPSHDGSVQGLGISPDGKRIVTCEGFGEDRNVSVWDLTSGKEVLTLPFDPGEWNCLVAYSPDGQRIAVASDGIHYAKVWDAATGKELLSGNFGHSDWLRTIAFSPDGKLAATGGADEKVNVWDTTTGQVLYTLAGHNNGINGVAFSPDGKHLASASWEGTARIWDITPIKESQFIPINAKDGWSMKVSYSPDGTGILTDDPDENAAKVWDAASGKEVLTLTGVTDQGIGPVFYSRDGKMVAGLSDKAILIWDAKTGKKLGTLVGDPNTNFTTITFSPDGTRLASASDDDKISIWDLASSKALNIIQGPGPGTRALAYSPDGIHLASGDFGSNGIIWDTLTGEKSLIQSANQSVYTVAYSPDGKKIAFGGIRGLLSIWDAVTGQVLLTLKGHQGAIYSIAFSADGKRFATASPDGTVKLWDATTGVNLLTLPVENHGAGGVSFSPDGKRLAVGGPSGVHVYILPIDEVVALAKSRVTRRLTIEDCQTYLHVEECPAP